MLVVDDDEDLRDSVAYVLRDEGYEVQTAANGKEALALLDTMPPPSVVLLDLMMPVMNGWRTLEAIRERGHAPPVVVVSASVPPSPDGATAYLRKPLDVDTLLAQVNAVLQP